MNAIYKYSNFQYNGIAALKPPTGSVYQFLTQDQQGVLNFVIILDANIVVTSKVAVQITGAAPANLLLEDDPGDTWSWNPAINSGNFSWTTQPNYTDGVIIGPINFIDNYCVRTSFTQVSGAITSVSILSGNTSSVAKVITQNYTSGSLFQFCQYPSTASTYTNASCPTSSDGTASIAIVFGPPSVQYAWFNSAGTKIATTANVTGLPGGTYTITVTDPSAAGCNAERTITIFDNALNGASVSTTPFACTTLGTASAAPNGGAGGFTYSWFVSGGTSPIGTGSSISGLAMGNYYVSVTDRCGSSVVTNFTIGTSGCCGDGICQASEQCGNSPFCAADCGICCTTGTMVSATGGACIVCPPGTSSTGFQSTSCTPCPANTFNAGGDDTCEPCAANYFSTAGSGKCVRCAAGQIRATTDTSCSPCGAGSYAPACDSSPCTSCPAGTMSAASGATTCLTCPPGTASSTGASSCTACPIGFYSGAAASSCTQCPSGMTTMATGATHLLACN